MMHSPRQLTGRVRTRGCCCSLRRLLLALAAVGLYGLVSQIVSSRRREMGVRMALGAAPRQIVASVVAGAGRLIASGIALGLVLTIVSVLAALVPARRAAAIDPVESMRAE